jgi:hypothetical protein
MGYLPNFPREPAPLADDEPPPGPPGKGKKVKGRAATLAKAEPPPKADPPTMGYLPGNPPPPREIADEEHPAPLAAPRAAVQASRLMPPKKAEIQPRKAEAPPKKAEARKVETVSTKG